MGLKSLKVLMEQTDATLEWVLNYVFFFKELMIEKRILGWHEKV